MNYKPDFKDHYGPQYEQGWYAHKTIDTTAYIGMNAGMIATDTQWPTDYFTDRCYWSEATAREAGKERRAMIQGESKPEVSTGGSNSYYDVTIRGQVISCQDIIEALKMNFAQGNMFKANWRICAKQNGNGKANTSAKYDLEKIKWFADRELSKLD